MFDEGRGKWDLRVKCGDVIVEDMCDVLVNVSGILSQWHWPDIKGTARFKGTDDAFCVLGQQV